MRVMLVMEDTMRRKTLTAAAAAMVLAVLLVVPGSALAQLDDTAAWASNLLNTYRVVPNVTYGTANNRENKVDLYLPRGADGPTPVLMYIHGGGWVGGSKESNVLRLLPWLEKGWAVVNVQYRLGRVSLAPAAIDSAIRLLDSSRVLPNRGNMVATGSTEITNSFR